MVKAFVLVFVAVALLLSSGAEGGCPSKQTRNCVINLTAMPQISQQIVASERVAPKGKAAPSTVAKTPYTGPTIGVTPTVRMYPTVGYHWSFD